jgi:hypothetical protein
MSELVRSLEEAQQHIRSLSMRIDIVEKLLRDHDQRFDTLQTSLWKRAWFRLDGWPGQRNLNSHERAWRPWH